MVQGINYAQTSDLQPASKQGSSMYEQLQHGQRPPVLGHGVNIMAPALFIGSQYILQVPAHVPYTDSNSIIMKGERNMLVSPSCLLYFQANECKRQREEIYVTRI